jgi:RHS repeat-associated protein
VDGRPVFAWIPGTVPSGPVQIFTSGSVAFGGLVVAGSPQIAATYFDGAARQRQGHSIEDTAMVVTETVYDSVGRAAVKTKPALFRASAAQPLLAYRPGFVSTLDWSTGVMTGEISNVLPADDGYPYSRQRYETSPLSRVVESGQPGKDFAITPAGGNTSRVSYGPNVAGGFPTDLALPAGEYRLITRTDPDGVTAVSVSDKLGGRVAAGLLLDPGSSHYITTSYLRDYQPAAQVETLRLPNYHRPPDPAHRDAWIRVTTTNLAGRVVSRQAPGSGQTTFIYDQRGQVRFCQDAASAAGGVVLYRRYDPFGRMVEEGTIPTAWDPAFLQQKADASPDWPSAGDGAVAGRVYAYDGDGVDVLQMGLLTHVAATSGRQPVTVEYRYDDRTRIAAANVAVPVDGQPDFLTTFTYDNIGNVRTATYPSGTTITAVRDAAGRVSSVADQTGAVLASYHYDPGDRVLLETVNPGTAAQVSTQYSYASPGWLQSVENAHLKQSLAYTSGGYQGAGYHSGKIARQEIALQVPGAGGGFPADLAYEYAYDPSGRLLTAQALVGGQPRADLSLGVRAPITYDDNGNFLVVPDGGQNDAYHYAAGSDFVVGTSAGTDQDYVPDPDGAARTAAPHGVTDITYDPLTRLPVTITTRDSGIITLQYGADGRRSVKQTQQGTLFYSRGARGVPVLEEFRPVSGPVVRTEYVHGPTGLLVVRAPGRTLTVLRDHLNTPRLLVDQNGTVVSAVQYLPFGGLAGPAFGQSDALRYGFAGYELDPETGLYNAGARLYDPVLRRFLSVDPALQFASPYLYAGNNPAGLIDPDGQSAWWATLIGAFIGALVTVVTGGALGAVGATIFGVGMAGASAADVVASAVVGGIAGAAGSVVGDAVTAGINHEPFTGQRAMLDILTGLAGGAAGAGVGGLAGAQAAKSFMQYGITAVKYATHAATLLAGGAAGLLAAGAVSASITGQNPFSGSAIGNLAIGALAGFGAGLLASGSFLTWSWFNTVPVPLDQSEWDHIQVQQVHSTVDNRQMLTFVSEEAFTDTAAKVVQNFGDEDAIFNLVDNGVTRRADVIAIHAAGRWVFPLTDAGYNRPMRAADFGQYLAARFGGHFSANVNNANVPLKLSICFGAQPFDSMSSVAGEISGALGRNSYAGRGLVTAAQTPGPMSWVMF